LSRVSWKLSCTVLRGADGGNAARLLDQKIDAKTRHPFAFALKSGKPYAFAGLWERWRPKDGAPLETFTIVTTDPNELVEPMHDRMPAILEPHEYDRWLTTDPDNANPNTKPTAGDASRPPIDLLRPYPAEKMMAWRVADRVGNVRNDDAQLLERVEPSAARQVQGSLFTPEE
jgi:putative SOS response-associated peptidase YedK